MELRGPGELFGTRQSGTIAEGASLMGSDAEMLKTTHDLAAELLNHPGRSGRSDGRRAGEGALRGPAQSDGAELRHHRTIRRRVGLCLFRHLRHTNSSIYLQ